MKGTVLRTNRLLIGGSALFCLISALVLAPGMAAAAGSTEVEHLSFTKPSNVCGISGTSAVDATTVFRDTGNGTYFMNFSFFGVFTADNGRSATVHFAGPQKQTSPA